MEHGEAEVLIGMQQHGALAGDQAAVLDAHLAGCAACRAFRDSTQAMESAMATNSSAVQLLDLKDLSIQVRQLDQETNRLLRNIAAAISVLITAQYFLGSHSVAGWGNVLGILLGGGVAVLFIFLPKRRQILERVLNLRTKEELLDNLRKRLDTQIKQHRMRALIGLTAAPALLIFLSIILTVKMRGPTMMEVGFYGLATLWFGLAIYDRFHKLPRLRAERSKLA